MITTSKQNELELLPDPERIVNGLRDTGYNFNTAIADIIDNSIAAESTKISVNVNMMPDMSVKVYIADNGIGMNEEGIINAMRYGSKERAEKHSLGKFGLGLKTASTAFCRKLSVLSRSDEDNILRKVQWNLDYIGNKGAWLLLFPEIEEDEIELLEDLAGNSSGTLVVWDKIDRLMKDYKSLKKAQKGLSVILEKLRFHLSMVYQRFLDPNDNRAATIELTVNGQNIAAWDPFCSKEPNTELLQNEDVPVNMPDGSQPKFHIAAYVIPKKGDFSSLEAEKEARGSNDFQGIYVYRENRLIHSGDWFGFLKKEPHFSLLRVEFSFNYDLDELLSVDIKKSRILLIGELATFIMEFLGAPRREAEKRYREKESAAIHTSSEQAHKNSNENIDDKAPELENSTITPNGENSAEIENNNGKFTKAITILNSIVPDQNRVVPVPSIEGNALWEPSLVDGKHAVNINESHLFYKKVYGPYLAQHIVVEGLDDLLWALAEAENSTCNQVSIENYEDMRFTVSRILKKLVANLPEPEIPEAEE
jgi:hypothetical protein